MLKPELHDRFEDPDFGAERVSNMESVWDLVWRRRFAYFLTLGLTLVLLLLSLWVDRLPPPPFLADGRTWLGEIIRLFNIILPDFLEGWVDTAAANSFYVLLLGVLIAVTMWRSSAMEGKLRDHARAIWRHSLSLNRQEAEEVDEPEWRLRTSPRYQKWMQKAKWVGLPGLVGVVLLFLFLWVALGLVTQVRLPWLEGDTPFCAEQRSRARRGQARLQPALRLRAGGTHR